MSDLRRYGTDHLYGESHRMELREFHPRVGHRFHVADRDWTEACCACRQPLLLIEEHRNCGQDLGDKGTAITYNLAKRAKVLAFQVAWHTERPPAIQQEN